MSELFAVLLPILVVDVLNPVLFGLLVFAAGSGRAFANSAALLAGHTISYFLAGIAVSFGVERISGFIQNWYANPGSLDFAVGAIIGVVCLIWAFRPAKSSPDKQDMPEWELTPIKCLGFGAVVSFVGFPFAVPYFAAVDQILKADLHTGQSLLVLAQYNVFYALPFAMVPATVLIIGDRSKPLLEKLNQALESLSIKLMPVFLGLLGLWLLVDAAYYFITGIPLV